MTVYVTADLHIGHEGILGFRKGLFRSMNEHDRAFKECINGVCRKNDTLYVLGDFIWNQASLSFINELNCQVNWVLGNHDPKINRDVLNRVNINFCAGVWPYKHGVVFTHVPIHPQELAYRWEFNVHGHIHHRERCIEDPRYYNANVDIQGIQPLPFNYILDLLHKRTGGKGII